MYGLPKIHKTNCPKRPICSAIGTSTYQLSNFVAKIIKPAACNVHDTDLNDTFQFIQQINGTDISEMFMVSFDVQSLFTNIPLDETIDICMDRLYRSDHAVQPDIPEKVLKHLLKLCVKDNVFVFQGCVYYQVDGVAMGNALGPILANIFMANLEETKIIGSPHCPTYYRRYVDDTFCLFKDRDTANKFFDHINTLHPSIKFDLEIEVMES